MSNYAGLFDLMLALIAAITIVVVLYALLPDQYKGCQLLKPLEDRIDQILPYLVVALLLGLGIRKFFL